MAAAELVLAAADKAQHQEVVAALEEQFREQGILQEPSAVKREQHLVDAAALVLVWHDAEVLEQEQLEAVAVAAECLAVAAECLAALVE